MVFEKLTGVIVRTGFRLFEPLIPVVLTYFLSKKMKRWEEKNLIQRFKVKVGRLEKYHYTLDLDIRLTEIQAKDGIRSILNKSPIAKRG